MDSLPRELIELILLWDIRMCHCEKNTIIPLRLVCKAFDAVLKPYVFKTLQLEFSKFLRNGDKPDTKSLDRVGEFCQAVYLDMMIVRDEEEVMRLSDQLQSIIPKVPEIQPLLDSLRQYCMSENTFDETDFRRIMDLVSTTTPNMTRLKLNLPFQVLERASTSATLLLATTFACVANRPEEYKRLETLVLDHLTDTTVINICKNHIDVGNTIKSFCMLKNLVLSFKRQEPRSSRQTSFTKNLWLLIRKATKLESLCLIGWNAKRDVKVRRHRHSVGHNEWTMRSLPYEPDPTSQLSNLRYLELKRVDIDPRSLLALIGDNSQSLKEIYLNEVYIKVWGSSELSNTSLWIGHQDTPRPSSCCWVAEALRNMPDLKLDVIRATGLGYDDFDRDRTSMHPEYDLTDLSGLNRSFDQRFVEAVLGNNDIMVGGQITTTPSSLLPSAILSLNSDSIASLPASATASLGLLLLEHRMKLSEYDVEAYQRYHNTTSHFKKCIDGYFFNHNEEVLRELQQIITVADRGMTLITEQINQRHAAEVDAENGALAMPPVP